MRHPMNALDAITHYTREVEKRAERKRLAGIAAEREMAQLRPLLQSDSRKGGRPKGIRIPTRMHDDTELFT